MKRRALGVIGLVTLLAIPAAAQQPPESQIVEDLPVPLPVVLSQAIPLESGRPSWAKVFDDGLDLVQIFATDYGALEGLELVNTFRGAADGAEAGFAESFASEGVQLGPATFGDHATHVGVGISERALGPTVLRIAHYLEGTTGFHVVVVSDDRELFETVLGAQLDHSIGERIEWATAEADAEARRTDIVEDAYESGFRSGQIYGGLLLLGLAVVSGWFLIRRLRATPEREEPGEGAAPAAGTDVDIAR